MTLVRFLFLVLAVGCVAVAGCPELRHFSCCGFRLQGFGSGLAGLRAPFLWGCGGFLGSRRADSNFRVCSSPGFRQGFSVSVNPRDPQHGATSLNPNCRPRSIVTLQ